jgi:hypothetical protein
MESAKNSFEQVVKRRLEALGTTVFAVEQRAGLPPDSLRNVLRGSQTHGPTLNRVQEICDALDLELYFGPRRIASSQSGLAEDGNVVSLRPRKGWPTIPWHDDDPHPGAPPVAFDPVWIAHHQLTVERLAMVVPVRGGDTGQRDPRETLAMVDRIAAHQGGPHLWALLDRKSVTLRLVQFSDPDILIFAPRPGGATIIHRPGAPDLPKLLGRVLWTGNLL